MRCPCPLLVLALLWVAAPTASVANTLGCGGDAFTFAEVVDAKRPQRGPVTSVPSSLCADLSDDRPKDQIPLSIQIGPREDRLQAPPRPDRRR
jgi:hypothetical protein